MNIQDIAIVVNNENTDVSIIQTIDAIKNAGFKNVFIQWYNENWDISQEEQLKYVRQNGLNIIFAHLGYQNINNLWLENEEGNKLVDRYIKDIKACKENGIPLVVMHLSSKFIAPKYNKIGLQRLQKIIDYADSLNIKVAFENTKLTGYIDYVIENIPNSNVGICFDSGHYHAFFNDKLDFAKFKNKIFALHLHDNDKNDDLHLIPFDGTLNWDSVMKNLKISNYNGPITLECCYQSEYLNIGIENFYKKCYEVGQNLKEMFNS